jgi:hypothetical protein
MFKSDERYTLYNNEYNNTLQKCLKYISNKLCFNYIKRNELNLLFSLDKNNNVICIEVSNNNVKSHKQDIEIKNIIEKILNPNEIIIIRLNTSTYIENNRLRNTRIKIRMTVLEEVLNIYRNLILNIHITNGNICHIKYLFYNKYT